MSKPRQNRIICISFNQNNYNAIVGDARRFRSYLDSQIENHPELFPYDIASGYRLKDIRPSAKLGIPIRRINVSGTIYTVRPSFVMPYLTDTTDVVEKALFLRKFAVPFWGLAYVFGRNPMYWHRVEQSISRHELVGTTVRYADDLPKHLVADEKHTRQQGEKVYVATTCGEGCVFGASVATEADERALTAAYGVFKTEAQTVEPTYEPETVCLDAWTAGQNAWRTLFSYVILITCFLHIYIKH